MGYYTYTDVPNVQWKQKEKKDYESKDSYINRRFNETLKRCKDGILGTLVRCNEDVPSFIHPCVDTFSLHNVCIR